jgi:hypothetical protein
MSIYLICEGHAEGLDVRVLNLVIAQKLRKAVQIIPAGGGSSLGSVAAYFEARSRKREQNGQLGPPSDRAYAIEDRDYRSLLDIEPAWRDAQEKRLRWRRHKIENYLLESRIVDEAFQSLRRDRVRGADRLPEDAAAVYAVMRDLAQPMLEDHAGWLAYWSLVTARDQGVATWFKGDRPKAIAEMPCPGRAEWIRYLEGECRHLKASCDVLAANPLFENPEAVYDARLAEVSVPEFFSQGQFLLDLDGHRLMSILCDYVNRIGLSTLSREGLKDELIKALDRLYAPGFFLSDDFAELAQRLV